MLYVLLGYLKPNAGPIPQSVQVQTTDFVGQPFIKVRTVGPLRDASGQRVAVMMMFEHESREAAERFAETSPYIQAGILEDHRLYEYDNEIG
ncbi:MAG TPA: YciI family protein [Sphingomicrobium sp.]|jgi:uncharacterized protein YciI